MLCRLRPGTPSSLVNSEPGPGGTVTTCYRGHRHRFRLDWVFPPDASQEEVMLYPYSCVDPPLESPGPPGLWSPSASRLNSSKEGRGGQGGRSGSGAGHLFSVQGFPFVPSPSSVGPGETSAGLDRKVNTSRKNFSLGNWDSNLSEVTARCSGRGGWGAAVVGSAVTSSAPASLAAHSQPAVYGRPAGRAGTPSLAWCQRECW